MFKQTFRLDYCDSYRGGLENNVEENQGGWTNSEFSFDLELNSLYEIDEDEETGELVNIYTSEYFLLIITNYDYGSYIIHKFDRQYYIEGNIVDQIQSDLYGNTGQDISYGDGYDIILGKIRDPLPKSNLLDFINIDFLKQQNIFIIGLETYGLKIIDSHLFQQVLRKIY